MDTCEPLCEYREPHPSPLQKHQVILTVTAPLWPLLELLIPIYN